MTPTKHPLIEMVYNNETGTYIGMLERKLVIMTLENLKMRSLLELLTGDMWDDVQFDLEDKAIFEAAVSTLERRLQISHQDALNLVTERWKACNPPEAEDTSTWLIGAQRSTPPKVISYSRPIGNPPGVDMKKHLEGLEVSRAHMQDQVD
jgi:hypothetical protein